MHWLSLTLCRPEAEILVVGSKIIILDMRRVTWVQGSRLLFAQLNYY